MDCGPACIKIVAKHYGKEFSMQYLRKLSYITREGVSLFDIAKASEEIGFRTLAIKVSLSDLVDKMPLPVIVHWEMQHIIVVYKITKRRIYVSDPAIGLIKYSYEEFQKGFEAYNEVGSILVLECTPDFYTISDNETRSSFTHFMKYLRLNTYWRPRSYTIIYNVHILGIIYQCYFDCHLWVTNALL